MNCEPYPHPRLSMGAMGGWDPGPIKGIAGCLYYFQGTFNPSWSGCNLLRLLCVFCMLQMAMGVPTLIGGSLPIRSCTTIISNLDTTYVKFTDENCAVQGLIPYGVGELKELHLYSKTQMIFPLVVLLSSNVWAASISPNGKIFSTKTLNVRSQNRGKACSTSVSLNLRWYPRSRLRSVLPSIRTRLNSNGAILTPSGNLPPPIRPSKTIRLSRAATSRLP